MRWICPNGKEPDSPHYKRAQVERNGRCLTGYFGLGLSAELAAVEVWRDGVRVLTAAESGVKTSYQVWSISVPIA